MLKRLRRILRIIFDLDDTLIRNSWLYNEPMWKCGLILSRVFREHCIYSTKLMVLRSALDNELIKTMQYNIERFPTSWVMQYRRICDQLKIQPDPKVERKLYRTASRFTSGPFLVYPGTFDVLMQLKAQGHQLYIVTSGPTQLQNRKIDESGLRPFFDRDNIFPVPMFKEETMMAIAGENPSSCVMFGDSPLSDIEPANKLGITSVWKSESTVNPDQEVTPDWTVSSITELPAIIERLSQ